MWKSAWMRWGVLLGLALGGFFDGILLHQILQWHHLLSLVPGMADVRLQVLWDGYFHALMYLLTAAALWGLWRARNDSDAGWGGRLPGAALIGFGLWHVVDAVASHWVLGIHRIRLDSDSPLFWDLIWLAAFGLAPLLIGWLMLRRGPGGGLPVGGQGLAVLAAGLLTTGAAAWSLRPPADQAFTTVVFAPGAGQAQVWRALSAADARLVWSDPAMGVVVVDVAPDRRWGFYRRGALLVSGSGAPAGCFNWSRV